MAANSFRGAGVAIPDTVRISVPRLAIRAVPANMAVASGGPMGSPCGAGLLLGSPTVPGFGLDPSVTGGIPTTPNS